MKNLIKNNLDIVIFSVSLTIVLTVLTFVYERLS